MAQTIPATAVLGPGLTGLAIGYRVLNLDRTEYSAFATTDVVETGVAGTYTVEGGVLVPSAGGHIVWGVDGTDYAEATLDPILDVDAIWAASERTLTSTPEETAAALTGSALSISIGASYSKTITGLTIPATWTKAWLTAKRSLNDTDAQAMLQMVVSNPADVEADGLLTLNGTTATLSNGSLELDVAAGEALLEIVDTTGLEPSGTGMTWKYDIKLLLSTGRFQQLTASTATATRTPTQATE